MTTQQPEAQALSAAPATPTAEQQVIIDFAQVGTAGPFPVVDGRVSLPDCTMQDLVRMLRPTYEAEQAVHASVKGAMWFTKKPVTIQAIQWTGDNLREVIAFTDGPPGPPDTRTTHAGMAWEAYTDLVARDGLKIYTLEGKMLASPGDWIIRGVKGEYYPCKDEIFRLTYAAASPTPPAEQAAPKAAPGEQFDPEGFRAWVLRNLPDDTIIGSSAWWADHLTTWAQRFMTATPQPAAQQGAAYAELEKKHADFVETVGLMLAAIGYKEDYARQWPKEKASVTFRRWFDEQRASHGQAGEPVARYTIEDVRKARSEGYRNGVESSAPSKITKEMRHAFREKYKESSIWADRLDIALEGMLAVAPQPAPAPLSEMPYEKRKAIQEGEQISASDAWFKARHEMLDTVDRRNVFRAGFDRGWSAALAAQGGKDA